MNKIMHKSMFVIEFLDRIVRPELMSKLPVEATEEVMINEAWKIIGCRTRHLKEVIDEVQS